MSNRATNLNIPFTFQFNVASSGTPEQLGVKISAATIAFVDNAPEADTITDTGLGFLAAGFQAGDSITVSGSASNDGTYVVTSVAAGVLTLRSDHALTAEAAGSTIKITATKYIPDGIAITVKAKNANTGLIYIADSSAKALNTSGGGFSLDNNESVGLQISSTDELWLDATVDGEGVEVLFEKGEQA